MTGKSWRWVRVCSLLALLGSTVLLMTGCGNEAVPFLPETTVAVQPGEDLAGPCTYALRLTEGPATAPGQPPAQIPQTAVLVIFERSDSLKLFDDTDLIAAAQKLHMSMLYAYECDAASFSDLQAEATKGPGRALFQALTQFSQDLDHPELATADVFLTGFSAGGFLSMTVANEYPARVLGIVPYAPASAYYDLDNVAVTAPAAQIPTMILVSATDVAAGDQRPMFLFNRGYEQGGPWGFASQQALNHCCVDSIEPLLTPWMNAVFAEYTNTGTNGLVARKPVAIPVQPNVAFQIADDGSFDPFGWQDFYFGSVSITASGLASEPYQAWVPDQTTANAWLSWVSNPDGN